MLPPSIKSSSRNSAKSSIFSIVPINSGDGGNANELKSDEFIALLSLTKNGGMYFFISTSIGSVMM